MKRKNLIQRMTMPLPELEEYYRYRRKERFEQNVPFSGVKLRKMLHPLALGLLKMMAIFTKQKITVIADHRSSTDRPIIFASTHIGWDDPAIVLLAIRDHAYLFWGDPKNSYKTIDGFFMDLNGAIICDTHDKEDRNIGKQSCIKWLKQGGNLLVFPEGAWNVTENLPVMPLFPGVAEMAIRTGAEIVPIAFEKFGKNFYVNIGANISPDNFILEQKQELTYKIRDVLATLKWELWEKQPQEMRSDIPRGYRQQFLQGFTDQIPDESYSLEAIEITRFHTKEEIAQKEIESHLNRLIPCKEIMFLFRKRPFNK